MRRPKLKSLSLDQLIEVRNSVGVWISKKAKAAREELEAKLSSIESLGDAIRGPRRGRRSLLKGRKVAPKYRNPKTGETWSGRGAMAGWLAAAIKAGKKKDSFLITRGSVRKRRRKTKK